MPSKRNKAVRAAQLQPQQAQQSDYDTDTANLTDSQPPLAVVPPPPTRSTAELNLLVLRRHYPEIEHIIAIAPFSVLYTFAPDTQVWEKCETQGTLFVCQISGAQYPYYRVVILNRKNLENFTYDIVSGEDIEVTTEYVIVQKTMADGSPQVFGIWIFSDGETVPDTREVISGVIMDCAQRAEQYASGGSFEEDESEVQRDGFAFGGTMDARPPYEAYEAPVQAQLQSQIPQTFGQQIDLATLFAKPQVPQSFIQPQSHQGNLGPAMGIPGFGQQGRFTPSTDTSFFRTSQGPTGYQQ